MSTAAVRCCVGSESCGRTPVKAGAELLPRRRCDEEDLGDPDVGARSKAAEAAWASLSRLDGGGGSTSVSYDAAETLAASLGGTKKSLPSATSALSVTFAAASAVAVATAAKVASLSLPPPH